VTNAEGTAESGALNAERRNMTPGHLNPPFAVFFRRFTFSLSRSA